MYHLLALFICTIWGITFVSTKVLLNAHLSPAMIFFLRFLLAYIGMILCSHKKLFCNNFKDELKMIFIGISGGSAFYLAENTALLYTQSGTCSFITSISPLLLAIYSVLRPNGIKSTWTLWVGTLLALVGLYGVIRGFGDAEASNPLLGNLIAFAAAVLWCVYSESAHKLSEKHESAFITRKMFFYGMITIIPFIFNEFEGLAQHLDNFNVIGNLLFLGILASWFNYFAWNKVITKIGSFYSSNYLYIIPLVTCIFSWLFLGEPLTFVMILGGVAILIGVYLSMNTPQKLYQQISSLFRKQ